SVICTLCTGFFSLAIIKGLLMIKYFTIEDLLKHYLQKKFHILKHSLSIPAPCGHGNIEPHQF
ncbi:hypothetical protein PZH31_13460, partial [[Ruminococcus] torques]|uniref:hypothetical protein n=1 Tax=[Ruminococcus] torques TaxID=33039 RepID=UPI0023B109B5